MRSRFHAAARSEFLAATAWYEHERPGLGEDFIAQLDRSLETIRAQPEAWPVVAIEAGVPLRRFVLGRFPYNVVFAVLHDELLVIAVGHAKRRPGYWRGRLAQDR